MMTWYARIANHMMVNPIDWNKGKSLPNTMMAAYKNLLTAKNTLK